MALPTVTQMIADLRRTSYAGRGGSAALAAALGIHPQSLKQWRAGNTEPTYSNRQALAELWQRECGGDGR